MTPRERAIAAFRGGAAKGRPTQIDFTPLAAQQAAHWLGAEVGELPDVLGNHLMSIAPREDFRTEGDTTFDAWGIGWDNTINDGYQVNVNPLADLGDLASYRFPDPDDPAGGAERSCSPQRRAACRRRRHVLLWERLLGARLRAGLGGPAADPPACGRPLTGFLRSGGDRAESGIARIDIGTRWTLRRSMAAVPPRPGGASSCRAPELGRGYRAGLVGHIVARRARQRTRWWRSGWTC